MWAGKKSSKDIPLIAHYLSVFLCGITFSGLVHRIENQVGIIWVYTGEFRVVGRGYVQRSNCVQPLGPFKQNSSRYFQRAHFTHSLSSFPRFPSRIPVSTFVQEFLDRKSKQQIPLQSPKCLTIIFVYSRISKLNVTIVGFSSP